ncbi:hypothetical protein [Bacillus sp. DNRA2]|nr:hypothetical protein [Bacillus sp. DNRA2]
MMETIVRYFPNWTVFVQAFIVFFIPYLCSSIFSSIQNSEKE